MRNNLLLEKAQELSNKIISLCKSIKNKGIYSLIDQLLRSGTSVEANIREANYPQSLADMLSKFKIAQKECFETEGWLQKLFDNEYIDEQTFKAIRNTAGTIRRILISSCKTIENKIKSKDLL